MKGESTSRKSFYRITKKNRLFVLETNYWGRSISRSELQETKVLKHNLRVVESFKKFYTIKKFKQIGRNLAKTFILSVELDKLKKAGGKDKKYQAYLKGVKEYYNDLNSLKIQRRKKGGKNKRKI